MWQRAYGGSGWDYCRDLRLTEEGGFILFGDTAQSGVSGNKGVDGDGIWVLKLDPQGLKQAEMVLPRRFSASLPAASGLSIISNSDIYHYFISDLSWSKMMRVNATSSAGRSLFLDSSLDFINWTPVVLGIPGDLTILEPISQQQKFYRIWEK